MKIKKEFALRQIADMWVVLPLGGLEVDFSAMLTLNESGAMLWKALEKGVDHNDLVATLTAEYDVSPEEAAADVDAFLEKLTRCGCICK